VWTHGTGLGRVLWIQTYFLPVSLPRFFQKVSEILNF
jgi:hypothetical protein